MCDSRRGLNVRVVPRRAAGSAAAATPPPPTLIKIRFTKIRRGQDCDEARQQPGGSTIAFDRYVESRRWFDSSHDQLWTFVSTSVAHGLTLPPGLCLNLRRDVLLFVVTDATTAPTYIFDAEHWRQVLELWRAQCSSSATHSLVATVFVELPAVSTCAETYSADLGQLQKGPAARRTGTESAADVKLINRTLDEEGTNATDVCRELLRHSELFAWKYFVEATVVPIFGMTSACHPHPATFFCWCGCFNESHPYCTKRIKAFKMLDLAALNAHLNGRCGWAGSGAMRKRMFEFENFGGAITTPLPALPEMIVPPRLRLDFNPNVLADGACRQLRCVLRSKWVENFNVRRELRTKSPLCARVDAQGHNLISHYISRTALFSGTMMGVTEVCEARIWFARSTARLLSLFMA